MQAPPKTRAYAKSLRENLSPPEVKLWMRLRHRKSGLPAFRRQHPFGPYILDFYCAKARLCVEIDGEGHLMGDRPVRDLRRTAYLEAMGVRVIRYAAQTVLREADEVAAAIFDVVADAVRRKGDR